MLSTASSRMASLQCVRYGRQRFAAGALAAAVAGQRRHQSQRVLLVGSGLVARPVLDHLTEAVGATVTVGSLDLPAAQRMVQNRHNASVLSLDASDSIAVDAAVREHDLVISLVPAPLHPRIAEACIRFGRNMVTSSYISPEMAALDTAAKKANITVLNEVGLDPGIDHLGAVEMIQAAQRRGGKVDSFVSWCGGLPSPEAATNPLYYKFSWSPRGALTAGLNPATYREDGQLQQVLAGQTFSNARTIDLVPFLNLEGYANRDSLTYEGIYGIDGAHTILRGTLRYKGFCSIMKCFKLLGLMDQVEHPLLVAKVAPSWARLWEDILQVTNPTAKHVHDNLTARGIASAEAQLAANAAEELGLLSSRESTGPVKTMFDALCHLLEKKLGYQAGERDLVVLCHVLTVSFPSGEKEEHTATLIRAGTERYSAMAETVGMPAALAAELLLGGYDFSKGVIRPTKERDALLLLERLAEHGIAFTNKIRRL